MCTKQRIEATIYNKRGHIISVGVSTCRDCRTSKMSPEATSY